MVERILSTAKLHRYLLEVPKPDDVNYLKSDTTVAKRASNFGYNQRASRGKVSHTEPQTLKGGIEIQLRNYVIAPYPTKSEEKLNESGFRIFTQVRKLKIQLKILGQQKVSFFLR